MEPEGTLRRAVDATVAAKSARIACFFRDGEPVPEDVDLKAEGIADLAGYRVLLHQRRGLTERNRARLRSESGSRLIRLLVRKRKRVRFKARFVIGPQEAMLGRKGVWSDLYPPRNPDGSLHGPEEIADPEWLECAYNPLWPLKTIAKVTGGVEEIRTGELVRGAATRRLSAALTAEHMAEHPWRWLAEARGPWRRRARRHYEPQPIETLVWVDADGRIRRISYLQSIFYSDSGAEPGWKIIELWDFGADLDVGVSFGPELRNRSLLDILS